MSLILILYQFSASNLSSFIPFDIVANEDEEEEETEKKIIMKIMKNGKKQLFSILVKFFVGIISVAGLIQIGENKIYLSHIFIVSVDSTRYLDADVCVCVRSVSIQN